MFEKSQKSYTDLLGKTNRIVEGTAIKGDLVCASDIRLDGSLLGNLQTAGKIVIGPNGSVTGEIVCRTADIEGRVQGSIQVRELLNIKSKASIHGEVVCGKLAVEPGADFTATCEMRPIQKQLPAHEAKKA